MISLNEITPSPGQHIAELIEQLADPVGNAARTARFEAALAEAIAVIERATKAPAVDLVRELTACQKNLEKLRDETKVRAEASELIKGHLVKRLDALRAITV